MLLRVLPLNRLVLLPLVTLLPPCISIEGTDATSPDLDPKCSSRSLGAVWNVILFPFCFVFTGLDDEGNVALPASRQNQRWPAQQGITRHTSV